MTLEDQLLQNLISVYKSKGVNLQTILDNPLFQALPLDKKISFVQNEATKFSAPKPNLKPILSNMSIGAISTIAGLGMYSAARGHIPTMPVVSIAGAVGAILGSVVPGMAVLKNYKRDRDTYTNSKDGMSTLINRSISSATPVPSPITTTLPKLITGLEHKTISNLHALDTVFKTQ